MQKILLICILAMSLLVAPKPVLAQSGNSVEIQRQLGAAAQSGNLGAPTDPRLTAARIIQVALTVLGTIFFCLCLYAGFLWMTAGGSEEKVTKSKSLLFQAVIGLFIILSAYAITWFVISGLMNAAYYDTVESGSSITVPQGTIY